MKRNKKRGSTVIEMTLGLLILMPLLAGTSVIGINLVRAIQVTQFCRDAGHMYAYGIDFAQTANQTLLAHLAQGLNFQTSGGNGAVIFSTVTFVAANDCTAAGLSANTTSCPNLNQAVFSRRFVVGDPTKLTSHFGTPSSSIIGANGYISSTNYLKDTSDQALGFTNLMVINSGQFSYLTEAYVAAPDLGVGSGAYSYNIF